MDSDDRYEYKPILDADGIRLIELQPCQDLLAPIQCRLVHTRLSLCDNRDIFSHYTALSYVWGNPEKSRTVRIEGKRLDITNNLHSALLDLRDEQRSLLLWADGICINQGDNDEKAVQIGLMGKIYSGALHTVIYLGSASSDDPECVCLAMIRSEGMNEEEVDLSSIISKEWFTRVWVFQELIFSQSPWLQCGRMRITWNLFLRVLNRDQSASKMVDRRDPEALEQ